jgi:hypothetical protein
MGGNRNKRGGREYTNKHLSTYQQTETGQRSQYTVCTLEGGSLAVGEDYFLLRVIQTGSKATQPPLQWIPKTLPRA